jgi:transposase
VRTCAPRDQTPVLREPFNWVKFSLIAGLTLHNFYFRIHQGSIRGPEVAEFLKALLRHIASNLLIVWDGAPIHCSGPVKETLASSAGRFWLERLPAYAPELNPVEYMWARLKEHEIANLLVEKGWELSLHATRALRRMRRRPRIIRACLIQAEHPI